MSSGIIYFNTEIVYRKYNILVIVKTIPTIIFSLSKLEMEFIEFILVMELAGEFSGISITSSSESPLGSVDCTIMDFFLKDLGGILRKNNPIYDD